MLWAYSPCSYHSFSYLTSTCGIHTLAHRSLIPETKGRSLEEMDVIFGSISAEKRQADIDKQEKGLDPRIPSPEILLTQGLVLDENHVIKKSDYTEDKV